MSGREREFSVIVRSIERLDPDRIEEYVFSNYHHNDEVQIQDVETGEIYFDNIGSVLSTTEEDQ